VRSGHQHAHARNVRTLTQPSRGSLCGLHRCLNDLSSDLLRTAGKCMVRHMQCLVQSTRKAFSRASSYSFASSGLQTQDVKTLAVFFRIPTKSCATSQSECSRRGMQASIQPPQPIFYTPLRMNTLVFSFQCAHCDVLCCVSVCTRKYSARPTAPLSALIRRTSS
jgi:hypothetical protein